MTKSEEILAASTRYAKVETVVDKLGRIIGVRRLNPAQRKHIEEMSPGLDGLTEVSNPDGEVVKIPRRAELFLAASVVEINDVIVTFPKNRGELDAILVRLDDEGLVAAAEGLGKLYPDDDKPKTEDEQIDQIKNSPGTQRAGKR